MKKTTTTKTTTINPALAFGQAPINMTGNLPDCLRAARLRGRQLYTLALGFVGVVVDFDSKILTTKQGEALTVKVVKSLVFEGLAPVWPVKENGRPMGQKMARETTDVGQDWNAFQAWLSGTFKTKKTAEGAAETENAGEGDDVGEDDNGEEENLLGVIKRNILALHEKGNAEGCVNILHFLVSLGYAQV